MADDNIGEKALAALNHPQDITFTVPLKLGVILLGMADLDKHCNSYSKDLQSMRQQIASQLESA